MQMTTLTMAEFRTQLASYCDEVTASHKPLRVNRGKKAAIVVMSEEDYASLQETLYLMQSPRNAERLMRSVNAVKKAKYKTRKLTD